MSVTNWKFANTAVDLRPGLQNSWANPTKVKVDDDDPTTVSFGKFSASTELRLSDFQFSDADIPAGSSIDGIEVIVKRKAGNPEQIYEERLYLYNKLDKQAGTNHASAVKWGTTYEEYSHGAADDDWDAGLTQLDIVDSVFGLLLSVAKTSDTQLASVDCIKIRVYYTAVPSEAAYRAQKGLISGYHCFMKQYIDFTKLGMLPLKLPDGTLW